MCGNGVAKSNNLTLPLKSAFDVLDADRDGKISRKDLHTFYSKFGFPNDENTIESLINAADSNKDGFVEFEEFERVLLPEKNKVGCGGLAYEVVEEAFKIMDGDGDGKVGCGDLKIWFRRIGMEVSEAEVMAMVRLGGGDEERGGGVTCDVLMKILGFDN